MMAESKLNIIKKMRNSFSLFISLKIVLASFIIHVLYFLISSGLFDYVFMENHDTHFKDLVSSFLNIDFAAATVYSLYGVGALVLIFYVSFTHINLKNRKYIYNTGRHCNFFSKYLKELFKFVNKIFISSYLGFLTFIFLIFMINICLFNTEVTNTASNLDIDSNIFSYGSRMYIPLNGHENIHLLWSLYKLPNLLVLVILWIPIYFAIVTYTYIVVILNEFTRSIVFTSLIIICYYFFLNPILKIYNLEILEPIHFSAFIAKGYIPMQYLMVTGLVNLVIILIMSILRKRLNVSEI